MQLVLGHSYMGTSWWKADKKKFGRPSKIKSLGNWKNVFFLEVVDQLSCKFGFLDHIITLLFHLQMPNYDSQVLENILRSFGKGATVRVISKALQVGCHFPLNLQGEAIEVVIKETSLLTKRVRSLVNNFTTKYLYQNYIILNLSSLFCGRSYFYQNTKIILKFKVINKMLTPRRA